MAFPAAVPHTKFGLQTGPRRFGSSSAISTMLKHQIQITRQGVLLGALPPSEALELLKVGFLQPDDQYCGEDLVGWKPLRELQASVSVQEGNASWLRQARQSLAAAQATVAGTAGDLANKTKDLVGVTRAKVTEVPEKFLSGFLPQIQTLISGLAQTQPFLEIQSGVRDDAFKLKLFGAAYDCLPKPVCRFVTEQQFVAFCMKHRAQLRGQATTENR